MPNLFFLLGRCPFVAQVDTGENEVVMPQMQAQVFSKSKKEEALSELRLNLKDKNLPQLI